MKMVFFIVQSLYKYWFLCSKNLASLQNILLCNNRHIIPSWFEVKQINLNAINVIREKSLRPRDASPKKTVPCEKSLCPDQTPIVCIVWPVLLV